MHSSTREPWRYPLFYTVLFSGQITAEQVKIVRRVVSGGGGWVGGEEIATSLILITTLSQIIWSDTFKYLCGTAIITSQSIAAYLKGKAAIGERQKRDKRQLLFFCTSGIAVVNKTYNQFCNAACRLAIIEGPLPGKISRVPGHVPQ